MQQQATLNSVYSHLAMRRRYEVWFHKFQLADERGAWWLRYLLTNPGRAAGGCHQAERLRLDPQRCQPLQVWATWFPRNGAPQSFIQGFDINGLRLSAPGKPLRLEHGAQELSHDRCRGELNIDGHHLAWDLIYQSTVGVPMSSVGWIGFSRTPHSDATFTGSITLDGQTFTAITADTPLGYGLQGHNCGFRHRNRWTWAHCLLRNEAGTATTFEALEYEIGFGLYFRRAQLWHQNRLYTLKKFTNHQRERGKMLWHCQASDPASGLAVTLEIDGSGLSLHRLPYLKTDCSGTFEVSNNSLAEAVLTIQQRGQTERLSVNAGAVLEMVGE